jgi:hypothetical protein
MLQNCRVVQMCTTYQETKSRPIYYHAIGSATAIILNLSVSSSSRAPLTCRLPDLFCTGVPGASATLSSSLRSKVRLWNFVRYIKRALRTRSMRPHHKVDGKIFHHYRSSSQVTKQQVRGPLECFLEFLHSHAAMDAVCLFGNCNQRPTCSRLQRVHACSATDIERVFGFVSVTKHGSRLTVFSIVSYVASCQPVICPVKVIY